MSLNASRTCASRISTRCCNGSGSDCTRLLQMPISEGSQSRSEAAPMNRPDCSMLEGSSGPSNMTRRNLVSSLLQPSQPSGRSKDSHQTGCGSVHVGAAPACLQGCRSYARDARGPALEAHRLVTRTLGTPAGGGNRRTRTRGIDFDGKGQSAFLSACCPRWRRFCTEAASLTS